MEDKASRTAVGVLAARAVYTIAPRKRRIINDPLAVHFLPPYLMMFKSWLKIGKQLSFMHHISNFISKYIGPGGASMIALRHRHIDDSLHRAVENGIKQVVILGAGFDSRAYRMDLPGVSFIEIDHPLTQSNKIKALNGHKINADKKVKLFAVDFQEDWVQKIIDAEILEKVPTYFIMEGVSYYLTESALKATFAGLKKLSTEKCKIIFDCFPEDIMNKKSKDSIIRNFRTHVELLGEPFTWGCDQRNIGEFLKEQDYTLIGNYNMQEVAQQLRESHDMDIETLKAHKYMYLAEASIH